MKFSLLTVVLLPVALLAQTTQTPAVQTPPPAASSQNPELPAVPPAASCPIRVDEAYLTSDLESMPAENTDEKRTLHVSLVDASSKEIVSYVVHAKIAIRPNNSLTNKPQTSTVERSWHGNLQPDTPTKEQWTFPADRFTVGLRRVWFDKVAFTDGTTWNKTANDGCSFAATGHIVQTK
jgi:hypothetical protein